MKRRDFVLGAAATAAAVPLATAFPTALAAEPADTLPSRSDILAAVRKVNDHWIDAHDDPGSNEWDRATYFSGAMAAYRLTGESRYLEYTQSWAEKHEYGLNGGVTTRHADNHCAGQVYLDLYEELGGDDKIADIEESLHRMVHTDRPNKNDDWWWVDALHMAMPPLVRLGALIDDNKFWVKMYALYDHTKRIEGGGLYNYDHELWYRDANFTPNGGNKLSPNGKPVFWSRGNGWAYAAHVKVLDVMPADDKRAEEYRANIKGLSRTLRATQRSDGFWNPNLGDDDHLPDSETSGTAFFAYAMAFAIREGIIDRDTYLPVVARAWNGLNETAVHPDGFLGWVQGIGAEPESSQPITYETTADFGVGAFLLAGSEVAALAS